MMPVDQANQANLPLLPSPSHLHTNTSASGSGADSMIRNPYSCPVTPGTASTLSPLQMTSNLANTCGRQDPAVPHYTHPSGSGGPSKLHQEEWVCPKGMSVCSPVKAKECEFGLQCNDLSGTCRPDDGDEDNTPTAPVLLLASLSSFGH